MPSSITISLDLARTSSLPYRSFVSLRSRLVLLSFTVDFLLPEVKVLMFCFLTGTQRLTSPLILSDTKSSYSFCSMESAFRISSTCS